MRHRFLSAIALVVVAVASVPCFAQTGTLKAQFVYGGSAFKPQAIQPNKDVEFCGKHKLVDESLLVNESNNGVKNVAFYVFTGRGGSKVDAPANPGKTVTLANDKCRFEPHVLALQVGDTLEITNPDDVGHNANLNFFANKAQNPLIPSKAKVDVKIEKPEPGVTKVECNIHPWMSAYVVALDHPFVAISDEDGMVQIDNLPAGKKLMFRVNHEAAQNGIKELMINGKAEALKKNMIEIEIKPGMNDLGKITIPADTLKKP